MKWFLDFTTRAKLFVGFGVMIAFLAVVIATAYRGITTIRESAEAEESIRLLADSATEAAQAAVQNLHALGQKLKQVC